MAARKRRISSWPVTGAYKSRCVRCGKYTITSQYNKKICEACR